VGEVIAQLQALQVSPLAADRDAASCLIVAFFEEYAFFRKYPDAELAVTARFLGQLIASGVMQGKFVLTGLKMILDAITVRGGRGGASPGGGAGSRGCAHERRDGRGAVRLS